MLKNNVQTNIKQKKSLLKELLEKWYNLQFEVKRQLMFKYDFLFGDLENDIENKRLESSMLEIKYKINSSKFNNQKAQLNDFVTDLSKRAKKRNEDFTKRVSPDRPYILRRNYKEKLESNISEDDINTLYKQLVKRLHPDIVGNDDTYRNFWEKVQISYKNSDIIRLKMLYLLLCDETKNDLKASKELLSNLENSIEEQQLALKNLEKEEPFCFADKLEDKTWIDEKKKELRRESFKLSVKITEYRKNNK